MLRQAAIAIAVTLSSSSAFAASFTLSPPYQKTTPACTISVSARDLVNAKGIDVEIVFDQSIVACASARFIHSALPGFTEFRHQIDNSTGSFETVLLRQTAGSYTGTANSFLVLTFEPVSDGRAQISIRRSYWDGNPLLVDESGGSIEATVDTAIVVTNHIGPSPLVYVTKLYQNYPNPFNPATTIRFDVSARSPIYLKIFDVNGRLVRVLIDGTEYGSGKWEQKWDGKNDGGVQVQSGVYLCVFDAGGRRMNSKLVILK